MGILLWLAEVVGGVALKTWLARTFGWGGKDTTAIEASRAEAEVQAQAQVINAEASREQTDESVDRAGVAAARDDMRKHWTAKD